jgi:hypothetical protein
MKPIGESCMSDPLEIDLVYLGGNCNTTWTDTNVTCVDYNSGPPGYRDSDATSSRILIESTKTPGLIYYDGLVSLGDEFRVTAPNHPDPIEDTLNVSIYSTTLGEDLQQSILIPFDCKTGDNNLLDRYGAILFTAFTSIEQGYWASFDSLSPEFTMVLGVEASNDGVSRLDLESLTAATNIEPYFFNFTEKARNKGSLEPDESFHFDLLTYAHADKTHNFLITLTGQTALGTFCRTTELMSYFVPAPWTNTVARHHLDVETTLRYISTFFIGLMDLFN